MKKINGYSVWSILVMVTILLYTCESEPECGCDGKKIFNLTDELGNIYYETESDYATFVSLTLGTQFVLCNPGELRDTLSTFEQGAFIYATGRAKNQCYNNPYAPRTYHLTMERIIEYKIDD